MRLGLAMRMWLAGLLARNRVGWAFGRAPAGFKPISQLNRPSTPVGRVPARRDCEGLQSLDLGVFFPVFEI